MRCVDCKLWGEGNGGGFSYDAGSVNYCNHNLISGRQHPSSASYDDNCISKVIVDGSDKEHKILTRRNFGCILFVAREGKE